MGEAHGPGRYGSAPLGHQWQRRGVPHLHCAIWFPDAYDTITPTRAWVEVASAYGAGLRGQHARIIDGPVGWFQYLAKHAARGVKHYQRTADSIPEGWQKKTGRVWGKVGHWPVQEKVRLNLQDQHGDGGWFAYRRLVRSWRLADARSAGDAYRIRSARAMLQCPDQVRARLIGYSSGCPTRSRWLSSATSRLGDSKSPADGVTGCAPVGDRSPSYRISARRRLPILQSGARTATPVTALPHPAAE